MFKAIKNVFNPSMLTQFKRAEKKFFQLMDQCSPEDILTLSPHLQKKAKMRVFRRPSNPNLLFGDDFKAAVRHIPFCKPTLIVGAGTELTHVMSRHELLHIIHRNIRKQGIKTSLELGLNMRNPNFKKAYDFPKLLTRRANASETIKESVINAASTHKESILSTLRQLSDKQLHSLKLLHLEELQAYDLSVRNIANAASDSFYQQSELQRECYSVINTFIRQVERERKLLK